MRTVLLCAPLLLAAMIMACGNDDDSSGTDTGTATDTDTGSGGPLEENLTRDIISTGLELDMEKLHGDATLVVAADEGSTASFETQGLEIIGVTDSSGDPLYYVVEKGILTVEAGTEEAEIQVAYVFAHAAAYEGYMSSSILYTWPYFCGNIFPCHSEPFDGTTFTLSMTGVAAPDTAVYPSEIAYPAPSYQLAFVLGEYSYTSLGTTTDGTELGIYWPEGGEAGMLLGAENLVDTFDWFEQILGPYPYGNKAASVQATWAYGGMEHHPYWHVGSQEAWNEEMHIHEAAHGWYGGGIRIECWEDFVLSEGTVSYLTARAIEEVVGPDAGTAIWAEYASRLQSVLATETVVAWPDSCGEIDILNDGYFSMSPYMKGAYFYKAVADEVGVDALDQVLAGFFMDNVGEPALMLDMLDYIHAETGFDPTDLAYEWLQTLGAPE